MDETLALRYEFRNEITDAVVRDLVGPCADDEIIPDPPITHYLSGILHPRSPDPDEIPADAWGIGDAAEDAGDDDATTLANSRYPSSMGLTFAVQGALETSLTLNISAGTYADIGQGWQRSPVVIDPFVIDLQERSGDRVLVADGLELFVRIRRPDERGRVSVTLALVNVHVYDGDRSGRDGLAFLQPMIEATLPESGDLQFVDRSELVRNVNDPDVVAGRLLFRHIRNLAVGHGCAVQWDNSIEPRTICTTFVPMHDLQLSDTNPDIQGWYLDMRSPATRTRSELVSGFGELVDDYERWIAEQRLSLTSLAAELIERAEAHLEECSIAASRMRRGVSTLADPQDDAPYRSFVLMSEAMVEQRIRSERILAGRSELLPAEIKAVWRPFQLGFILLCLDGVVDEGSADRRKADLLWFPTGGGKTEAYLGLIAFTLFLRRLRHRPHGVSALMRYTLRLLTAQQFERAALLMCCCEAIRRGRRELGDEKFEVGLFVGRAASPSTVDDAKRALAALAETPKPDLARLGNPIQIKICVWCGKSLGWENHHIVGEPAMCVAMCPDPECTFASGLPWWVVDEDLYRARPNLIIGTVDKFASLAWRENSGKLFNRGDGQEPGLDLIIQDELHLISGPLGTVTGLYETAVDELANNRDGVPAKVIASTATIRRATEQVKAVFNREVAQFPPPALDARYSYFATEAPADARGTRRYVGLIAPGSSQSTLLIRVFSRLFHQATLGDHPDEIRDTYWTLVGYFNSLRVLAGAQLQVLDDVQDRMGVISEGASTRDPGESLVELTSRASSDDISEYLRDLRVPYGEERCVDVVLATNMISVGVDVDRLGLMAVMGQPQATAEYIQATSRVGRRHPGLVFTMYNAARSRDRSHYESFLPYHSMLYRQVEATSATPFSPRARDRALHAVLVALVRHTISAMRANDGAVHIGRHLKEVEALVERVVARVTDVDCAEAPVVRQELEAFVQRWQARAEGDEHLLYEQGDKGLLVSADRVLGGVMDTEGSPTLWSMRDVDRVSQLFEIGV